MYIIYVTKINRIVFQKQICTICSSELCCLQMRPCLPCSREVHKRPLNLVLFQSRNFLKIWVHEMPCLHLIYGFPRQEPSCTPASYDGEEDPPEGFRSDVRFIINARRNPSPQEEGGFRFRFLFFVVQAHQISLLVNLDLLSATTSVTQSCFILDLSGKFPSIILVY